MAAAHRKTLFVASEDLKFWRRDRVRLARSCGKKREVEDLAAPQL
jgi:hypothetical protein